MYTINDVILKFEMSTGPGQMRAGPGRIFLNRAGAGRAGPGQAKRFLNSLAIRADKSIL